MPFLQNEKNDVIILKVDDERLDSSVAPELKAELLILAEGGTSKVLLDFTNVVYVDSSGLGAILFGIRQFRDRGGILKMFGAGERVLHLIKIAKLEDIVFNFDSETDALNSFTQ